MSLKYAIVEYPIPEAILLSGFIAQTNITARVNNDKTKCVVSYDEAYHSIFRGYPTLPQDELVDYLVKNPTEWDAEYVEPDKVVGVKESPAFASKYLEGGRSLFKRVHGVETTIPANSTGYLELAIPYAEVKFTGAAIFGSDLGDLLDFFVLDTDENTYSQVPLEYGANYLLNQFGFDVRLPQDRYENTSNYDASLYYSMILCCAYKNNTDTEKTIYMNAELHEVRA